MGWHHDGPRALIPRALRSRHACVCVARARRFCCARRCLPTSLVTRLGVTRHDCFCAAAVLDIFRFRLRIDFLSVFHCALCTQTLWGAKGIQKKTKKMPMFSNRKWGLESYTIFGLQSGPTTNTTYSFIFHSIHKMNTIPLVRRRMRGSGDRVLFGLHSWRCRMPTS